jgi:glycosyltransferase involved in cell wall biosynthesis
MKKKLLFVNQKQFGYHINFVQYCKYLKTDFDVIYLCWDYGKNKIIEEGIDIKYISRQGNIIQRNVRFIKAVFKLINGQCYHCIFINYFRGCSVIPFIYRRKHWIHLNIVTGNVSSKSMNRNLYNFLLRFESYFFKSVSIISEGLQKLLKVYNNAYILPLGADPMIVNRQSEHKISLLYIGAFGRRIDETVVGLGLFIRKHPDADIHYTIIGEGWGSEMEQIRGKIKKYELDKYVELKGYIPHNDLKQYYEKANVGVSYIPVTPWYEYQPATKTFEYLMAGMPVIATGTFENKKIINEQNGIIITDNPASFANCIELLYDRIDDFDENLIRESVAENNWVTIVSKLKEFICNQPKSHNFWKQKN